MTLVVISIDRNKLPNHTDHQFAEWVKFQVGHIVSISNDNPLHDLDIDAIVCEIGT